MSSSGVASSVETPPAEAGLDHSSEDGLTSQDVRTRAARGATMFVGRDVLVQFIGFATGLILARLLTPADFGITTLGLTIVGSANVIADGGIAASLISRKEPPSAAELRAVNGFQLSLTIAMTAIAVPLCFALGGDGPATAIILLSLPLYAVRTPPMLLFERRLQFAPRIIIQVAELITYGVVAIALALMGLGVWAMPLALLARAAAGTVYCYALSPTKWVLPTLRFGLVRPLLGFGVRFQLKSIVQLVRDIAVVSVVGSLGGLQSLGLYGLCVRLLQVPKTAATALGEVTFPAFSRLIGNGEDVGPLLKRTTLTSSLMNALTIAPLVAASPALIGFFFGSRWTDASLALPGLGIGLIVGGPLGWNVVNYLYATGDSKTPLWISGVLNGLVTIAFVAIGVKYFGLVGLGMGVAAGQLVTTPQLLWRVQRRGGPNLWRACLAPAVGASASMALGWWICSALHKTLVAGIAAFLAALALQVLLVFLTDRAALKTCWSTIKRAALLVLPARLVPQRSPNKKKLATAGVGLDRAVDQASLLTSVKERVAPSRGSRRGRRRRERYDREPLRDRLRNWVSPDRRTHRYRRDPLWVRIRAAVPTPRLHVHAFTHPRHRAHEAAADFSRKVRNRSWLLRIGCAVAAIALMLLLISGHGSPNSQPDAFRANGASGSASTSDAASQDNLAAPAVPASPAARAKRHVSTAARTHHTVPAAHHPTPVVRPSAATHPSASPAATGAPAITTPTSGSHPSSSSHHQSNSHTTPAAKQPAPSKPKQTSTPTARSGANPCSATGVTCQGGLIFGAGTATIATAPAIGIGDYQNLGVGSITLSQVISRFGAPLSAGALKSFIGAGSYSSLVGAQPSGDSCAYYLDSADRASRAFQLCFNGSRALAAKAIISTSGAGSSGSA
jgi:O-antigen/teichoic acid export membrane protein